MKKILALMLAVCLCMSALTACGREEEDTENDTEIIGTWSEDYFDSGYIFNEDLTGTDTFWELTFTYTACDGTVTISYDEEIWGSVSYTYVINGDYLTMTRISEEESGDDISSYTYTKVVEEETESEAEDESSEDETDDAAQEETDSEE